MSVRTFQWVAIVVIVASFGFWSGGGLRIWQVLSVGYFGGVLGVLLGLGSTWFSAVRHSRLVGARKKCFLAALVLLTALPLLACTIWLAGLSGHLEPPTRLTQVFSIAGVCVNGSGILFSIFGKGLDRAVAVLVAVAAFFVWAVPMAIFPGP